MLLSAKGAPQRLNGTCRHKADHKRHRHRNQNKVGWMGIGTSAELGGRSSAWCLTTPEHLPHLRHLRHHRNAQSRRHRVTKQYTLSNGDRAIRAPRDVPLPGSGQKQYQAMPLLLLYNSTHTQRSRDRTGWGGTSTAQRAEGETAVRAQCNAGEAEPVTVDTFSYAKAAYLSFCSCVAVVPARICGWHVFSHELPALTKPWTPCLGGACATSRPQSAQ